MFNVLTGLYQPSGGKVVFDGADVTGRKPHVIVAAGIARTFQNIRLFAHMTALENVMVGRHLRTHAGALGAVLRGAAHARRGAGDPPPRAGAARLRRHRAARARTGEESFLRRSAPAGDRARARHRARAAGAGRAGGRHERDARRSALQAACSSRSAATA